MKLTNPLPQPLPKECEKAAKIFKSFVTSGNNGLDGVIPREILERAKGFAIFTIVKAGFVFSARAGSGIVIARLDDGTWSAPSAIGTAGLGVGGQAGAEMTDFLIVLNSRAAIRSFMAAGSLTLGGNMSLALGPLGRNGEASGSLSTNGKVAAMYSYSKTRGLFGGVSVEGSVIVERQDANAQAYNSPVTARLLLGGTVDRPQWAMPLIKTLEACTGMPGNREWINDDADRTPGGTYAFGGVSSPDSVSRTSSRSPSFLRKKKKAEPPSFPPASWGTEINGGSYFSDPAPQSHSRNMTWDGGNRTNVDPFGSPNPMDQSYQSAIPVTSAISADSMHRRASSLSYSSSTEPGNPFLPSTTTQRNAPVPYIKPRIELTTPLPRHEGVARAIAIYDFQAAEASVVSPVTFL
uniref:Ysc84 actin-binding domain-containing protein n=1 Tax=Psilocybe cubensis TaxID=181762 RepID=A0A8H7YAK8_PSICU